MIGNIKSRNEADVHICSTLTREANVTNKACDARQPAWSAKSEASETTNEQS